MESTFIPVLIMLLGIAVGATAVWFALRSKGAQIYRNTQAESAIRLATFQERLAAREQEVVKLQKAFDREVAERETLREQNANLKAELEGERRAAGERIE